MSLRPSRTMSVLGSAVVALGATTAGLVAVAPAATAATCSGAGVSVVVDFKDLGGGQQTGCVTGKGGSSAATILGAAGVELTRARNQPGFVCRVQQVPASDPCVNASPSDAYWALWWSDGSSGSWSYASLGVDQLEIPEGGSVGFAWDDQSGQVEPGTAPPKAPAASPSPSQGSQGSQGGQGSQSGQGAQGGGTSPTAPAPTAGSASAGAAAGEEPADGSDQQQERADEAEKAQKDRRKSQKQEKADQADEDAETDQDAEAEEQDTVVDLDGTEPTTAPVDDPAGLPVWVAPAVLGLLAAGLAGLAVVRRRRRG
ncbi:hypothetical protein QWJ41_03890 [Nocardioides sp. SOB44]|uniref:Gram-positive cocci surface proteins LPxTG domain-containing protein n=1 Tax=Nocardioides cremeus TaxID=3058044 RepID=A0ABT8TRA8_9ACTN|nr:hypothetical protein [Nocardioides cremeus]MDO3394847.1 hypothetical protein [Nocardioides cremeus]